ncbi:TPA: hypothetical protein DCX15_00620 [bacterium]|nr:hypothetical protein [bacterium]
MQNITIRLSRGDIDTTAAMARAISGAYIGLIEAIPLDIAHRLTDRGARGFDKLVELDEMIGWNRVY